MGAGDVIAGVAVVPWVSAVGDDIVGGAQRGVLEAIEGVMPHLSAKAWAAWAAVAPPEM